MPAAGATIDAAPRELTLRFNNRIEAPLSKVRLVGAGGATHTLVMAARSGAPGTLVAAVPPLAPGSYRIEWQVLSTDGHIVSGSFSFRLGPDARSAR